MSCNADAGLKRLNQSNANTHFNNRIKYLPNLLPRVLVASAWKRRWLAISAR